MLWTKSITNPFISETLFDICIADLLTRLDGNNLRVFELPSVAMSSIAKALSAPSAFIS